MQFHAPSDGPCRPNFVNHLYEYRKNWTPLSPITIINYKIKNRAASSMKLAQA